MNVKWESSFSNILRLTRSIGKPRYFNLYFMENKDVLLAEETIEGPQKKRTRIAKKEVSDHVYSVSGEIGENLDQPKKKRTRKTKKEMEEAAAAAAAAEDVTPVEETGAEPVVPAEETPAETVSEEAPAEKTEETTTVVKRKRGRKSKEEIMAAAAAAASALAKKTQAEEAAAEKAEDNALQQSINFEEAEQGEKVEFEGGVPEEVYSKQETGTADSGNLLEQLQSKMNSSSNDKVWEGDPGDGTDFIIVEDIPVEDNGAIPYYDMLDNPQMVQSNMIDDGIVTEEEDATADFNDIITANGLLEIMPDGYGFLRSSDYNYLSSPDDVHLTVQQIRQYSLKTGDVVECKIRPPHSGEKYFTMSSILKVNGRNPLDVRDRISFENLTPLFPEERFNLCGDPNTTNLSTRIVDLFSPIGKGQRSLIVAQPKTGKTMLMKDIANAIAANHPEAYIMMLLIDERPEEVTDMARTVNAEVIASTFDEPADRHVKIAGLVLEKAKRLVECGHDAVIFLDSITRLARAYNTVAPASGKVLTGGVDANALQKPKRFFGAARNIEGGGSLTIIATALTDTGSKMDEVIFEEFKGTGNSELQLDRQLANKRIFPAVNLIQSSTRRDDLLLDSFIAEKMGVLRVNIADMNAQEAMTTITNVMKRSRNHMEFLMGMNG
ncbi:MAG: transcription termination factor Rho [Prevotella sp.]|nr:transcription termination factor Rho [Prevotella sp.]